MKTIVFTSLCLLLMFSGCSMSCRYSSKPLDEAPPLITDNTCQKCGYVWVTDDPNPITECPQCPMCNCEFIALQIELIDEMLSEKPNDVRMRARRRQLAKELEESKKTCEVCNK